MLKTRTNLLDIVELVEDLPEYEVKRGEQGVVVEVFDEPDEGYILEFIDPSGTSSRLAYWVKPEQIKRVTPRKAQELDVVELVGDLPEYGVKKGERAVVTTAFGEPEEAYDLEFADESGRSPRFAYSVKPEQIISTNEIADNAFAEASKLINSGARFEGRRKLREAVRLKPTLAGALLNSVLVSFGTSNDFDGLIRALRLVCELNPDYELARTNLVGAYLNRGIQQAKTGDVEGALQLFYPAMGIATSEETISWVKQNLAAAHTSLAIKAHNQARGERDSEGALKHLRDVSTHMARACAIDPNEHTRRNLGLAYAYSGNGLLKNKDFETAAGFFEVAEDAGVSFPELHNNHGVALAFSGQLDAAIEQFESALEMDPTHATAQFNMAQVYRAKSEGKAQDWRMEFTGDVPFQDMPVSQEFEYQMAA